MPNGHNKPSIGNNRNRKRKTIMNFVSANQGIRIPGFRVTLLDSYQNFYLTGRFQSEFHSQLCGTARSLNLKSLTAKFVFLRSRLPHLPSNTAIIPKGSNIQLLPCPFFSSNLLPISLYVCVVTKVAVTLGTWIK